MRRKEQFERAAVTIMKEKREKSHLYSNAGGSGGSSFTDVLALLPSLRSKLNECYLSPFLCPYQPFNSIARGTGQASESRNWTREGQLLVKLDIGWSPSCVMLKERPNGIKSGHLGSIMWVYSLNLILLSPQNKIIDRNVFFFFY